MPSENGNKTLTELMLNSDNIDGINLNKDAKGFDLEGQVEESEKINEALFSGEKIGEVYKLIWNKIASKFNKHMKLSSQTVDEIEK